MKNNKVAHFQYKCRRCGITYSNTACGVTRTLAHMHMYSIINDTPFPKDMIGMRPDMVEPHACEGGHLGVSDFIGIEIKEND